MNFISKNIYNIILIITGLFFLSFCLPFLGWILFAAIIAFSIKPIQNKFLIKKYKINKTISVYVILLILMIFLVPFVLSFLNFFSEGKALTEQLKDAESFESINNIVNRIYTQVPILDSLINQDKAIEYLRKAAEGLIKPAIQIASNFFLSLPMIFLGLFFFSASLYYFLADSKQIFNFISHLKLIEDKELSDFSKILQSSCQSTMFAAVITGFVQSLILSLTALSLGIYHFFTLFFMTFFLAQIPIIGSAPIAIGVLGYFYLQDNFLAVTIFLIATIISSFSDNVIRAWILNRYDSLHPLAGLISAIGALVILGPIGVLLGPVITLLFVKISKKVYGAL